MGVLAVALLACALARTARAYIDPGTGGMVVSTLAPILAVIGLVFVATFRYSWAYAKAAARLLWRHRLVTIPVAVALAAAVAYLVFRN